MERKLIAILFFALVFRLYHVFFPVGGWHDWRQADTAAMSRNFYVSGYSILYPQVDWRGNTSGFVESEFPIYQYSISLLYRIFGAHDFLGRLVSILFSIFTIYGLYLLVRKVISRKTALWAAFIYSILPFNIYFSRVFMPESTMIMCSVYGIFFFLSWTEEGKTHQYLTTILFITLACLIKLPTLYIGLPLAFIAYRKYGLRMFARIDLILIVILVFSAVGAWHYHAHTLTGITGLSFNIWNAGNDKWGMIDLILRPKFYNDIFLRNLGERHLTYAGFIILIWGLFLRRESRLEGLFDFYIIAFVIFILIAPQAHLAQDYYQLPFSVPASVLIAKIFSKYVDFPEIRNRFQENKLAISTAVLALLLIPALSLYRYVHLMEYEDSNAPIYSLTTKAKSIIPVNALIITVSDRNPACLYLAERKGWVINRTDISKEYIAKLKNDGAKFIIGEKRYFPGSSAEMDILQSNSVSISDNNDYFIFEL